MAQMNSAIVPQVEHFTPELGVDYTVAGLDMHFSDNGVHVRYIEQRPGEELSSQPALFSQFISLLPKMAYLMTIALFLVLLRGVLKLFQDVVSELN